MNNKNLINGWSIDMGDYIKEEDDYIRRHKVAIRKIRISKIIIEILACLVLFLFLLFVLSVFSKI